MVGHSTAKNLGDISRDNGVVLDVDVYQKRLEET